LVKESIWGFRQVCPTSTPKFRELPKDEFWDKHGSLAITGAKTLLIV
jgi:hypothetical protein